MKVTLFAFAAVGFVAAQNFDGIPECAIPCLKEAIPKVGCALDDQACQCNADTQSKLVSIVSPCLIKACSSNELIKVQDAAGAACAAYSATASGASATESATASASGSASTTVTESATDSAATTGSDTASITGSATEVDETATGSGSVSTTVTESATDSITGTESSATNIIVVSTSAFTGNSTVLSNAPTRSAATTRRATSSSASGSGSGSGDESTGTSAPSSSSTAGGNAVVPVAGSLLALVAAAFAL
ncbi:hypothetical protein G7046_g8562 [Stylonectria norvegica]|nr:hypothetical protein G7046_g8562 [Stylonectria norvegica]